MRNNTNYNKLKGFYDNTTSFTLFIGQTIGQLKAPVHFIREQKTYK